jgi:hypothetical protein
VAIDLGWLDERVQDSHMGGHTPGGSLVEMAAVLVYQRASRRHGDNDRRLGRGRGVKGWAEVLHALTLLSDFTHQRGVHRDTVPDESRRSNGIRLNSPILPRRRTRNQRAMIGSSPECAVTGAMPGRPRLGALTGPALPGWLSQWAAGFAGFLHRFFVIAGCDRSIRTRGWRYPGGTGQR